MVIVACMKGVLTDGLTSSFTAVSILVGAPLLYFALENRMNLLAQVLLAILSICFLYWAIWFWKKLQAHLAHMKDRKWLRAEEERQELLKLLKPQKEKKQKRKRRKVLKSRKTNVERHSRWNWFKRDWEMIDKTELDTKVVYVFKCRITGKIKTKVVKG